MYETTLGIWVRHWHLYGWDTDTCMGEIPQQLWAGKLEVPELTSTPPMDHHVLYETKLGENV